MKKNEEKQETVVYETHTDMFKKSNSIINSKYKSSLVEQKLFNIMLAKLQQRQYIDEGETGGLVCKATAQELKKMLGVTGGSFYKRLKTVASTMSSTQIGYVDDEREAFSYINVITSATYSDGVLTVKFNNDLREYLVKEMNLPFTILDLPIILSYKSVYALRLHEILLSHCYKKKRAGVARMIKKDSTEGKFKIEIGLSELKLSLGVVEADSKAVKAVIMDSAVPDYDKAVEVAKQKSFDKWYEFRRNVIDVAVNEINAVDNGTYVTYDVNKSGQGGRVHSLTFYVSLGEKDENIVDSKITKNRTISKVEEKENEIQEEKAFEVYFEVKSMVKEPLSLNDIKAICKAADYDVEKVRTAYEVACASTSDIDNIVGYLIKAIKEEYHIPVKKEGKKKEKSKGNKFNNFHQRDYNFAEYEKMLLNKGQNGDGDELPF